jgi:hypothetical protein
MADWPERIEEKLDEIGEKLDELLEQDSDDDEDEDGEEEPDEGEEEPDPPTPGGQHPSDVLPVLKDWTIMLPTGSPGDPDNEYVVDRSITDTYFVRGGGVVFRVYPAKAVHSKNSMYGRCEGRQMVPRAKWVKSEWPSTQPHRLSARLSIDTHELAHPMVNGVQIHDGSDDVIQVQSRDGVLGVSHDDGDSWEVLDPSYAGETFDVDVEVTGRGEIVFTYNGAETVRIPKSGSGWYWKAGCYPNTGGAKKEKPESPTVACEVVIYKLEVTPA